MRLRFAQPYFLLPKNPQDAKAHFQRKGVRKSFCEKGGRFFETHAFAVCVICRKPMSSSCRNLHTQIASALAYPKYADRGGFLAPAVFRRHPACQNLILTRGRLHKSAALFFAALLTFCRRTHIIRGAVYIPAYGRMGPARRCAVNHVRRGTEQH